MNRGFKVTDHDVVKVMGTCIIDGEETDLVCEHNEILNVLSFGYRTKSDVFLYHRIGEPSYINMFDGFISWDVHGDEFGDTREYCIACGFDAETTMFWLLKYGDMLPINVVKS